MRFERLLEITRPNLVLGTAPRGTVTAVTCDSRLASNGSVFVAIDGASTDGHAYVPAAARAGAAVCLVERPVDEPVCQVVVADTHRALARLAAEFFGRPAEKMVVAGITGTNGKTTVCHMVRAIMSRRWPTGIIGTVRIAHPGGERPAEMTTPDALCLHSLLAEMRHAGARAVAMEISSHALDQHRADFCHPDVAVFTNLSRDHLDYHGDMGAYFEAKMKLFNRLLPDAAAVGKHPVAVICHDDERGRALARLTRAQGQMVITYGLEPGADIGAEGASGGLEGLRLAVTHPGGVTEVSSPMVGRYNEQNLVGAFAAGLALGIEPADIAAGLAAMPCVPGRLERVPGPAGSPAVFVDYAHSPDAVAGALEVLRPLCAGRLICVFGAGGDRDKGKRPLMGQAAGAGADYCVLTSDNPRTEDPLAIIAMVEEGLLQSGARPGGPAERGAYAVEPDRVAAIAGAIASARPEDVVLIAGKGHETYQIIGRTKHHFDDREQAAGALAAYPEGDKGIA